MKRTILLLAFMVSAALLASGVLAGLTKLADLRNCAAQTCTAAEGP